MQPNSPLFRSGIQPRKLWDESRFIAGNSRQLQIFRWKNRLVCHEDSTDLWWATLDNFDGADARAFWERSIANERIARLKALRRGFGDWGSVGGARLELCPMWLDVLIETGNGGLARVQGESEWRNFAGVSPSRVRNPKANVPSVWSPLFRVEFARRALRNLMPELRDQLLQEMPASIREIAEMGDSARVVRLIRAALAQRWVVRRPTPCTLPEFWTEILTNAVKSSSKQKGFALPRALRESPEVPSGIEINLQTWMMSSRQSVLLWKNHLGTLNFKFWTHLDSAHERLEAKLELRDWLSQFFPPDEVKRWLQ